MMDSGQLLLQEEQSLLRKIFDDSKGRIMKNKIWGLMIILSCCLVSVSFAGETQFNLTAPYSPTAEKTWVEVSIEKNGHLEFLAVNSQPQGKVSMKLIEKVTILSGDYAGWGYAYAEYKYGSLKGAIYFVFQHDQWQGMLSGDLVGMAQQSNGLQGLMTWQLAKINGADSQGTVELAFVSYKPGKQSTVEDVWMPVLRSYTLSTAVDSTGHYTGPYEQQTTVLMLPAPDGNLHKSKQYKGCGLEFGTYEAGMDSGTVWSFIDNTKNVDPFNEKRYGIRDGKLSGTSEIFFDQKVKGDKRIIGTAIHVAPF